MKPVCVLAAVLLTSSVAAQGLGSVSGHVTCSDTHTPCRFASVTLQTRPPSTSAHTYSASTDLDGAFHIEAMAPGDYYVLAHLAGYLSSYDLAADLFPDESPQSPQALDIALTRLTVEPGHTSIAALTLSRGAALTGVVRYDDGAPAINLPIHLLRRNSAGAWKSYQNSAGAGALAPLALTQHTDEQGRFQHVGLPPGVYTMEATLPEIALMPATILGKQSLNVSLTNSDALRVFYGDKFRFSEAKAVELHQGESLEGLVLNVPTSGLHTLGGTVTAETDGALIATGSARLLDPTDQTVLRETTLQQDGTFLFHYLPSGPYLLQVEAGKGSTTEAHTATPFDPLSSALLVEADMPNLSYALKRSKR